MFCVLLIVVYLSLSVLFLIRTEWFKKCCGNLWNQWKHQHFFTRIFIVVFIAYMTVFATVKQPSEPTAPPAGTENTPFVQEVILSKISDSEDVSENLKDPLMIDPMLMDRNFYDSTTNIITRVVTNTALTWLYPPTNAVTYDRWTQYGVAEDTFWVPATNWAFVYGSNLVEGAHVSSSGTLSFNLPKSSSNPHGMPDGTGINFLAPFHSSLAVIPTNGCFWYAATDTNTMVFTWQSFLMGRDTNNIFSFQAELFYNGDFIYRYYFPTNVAGFTNDFVIGGQYEDEGETYFHNNFSNLVDGLRYTTDIPDPTIDTDGDGIYDIVEIYYGTDPYVANDTDDSDHDGISDNDEYYTIDPVTGERLDATNYDSDGDGIPDGSDPEPFVENTTDADGDGLLDVLELVHFDSITNGVVNNLYSDQNFNGTFNKIDLLLGRNPLISCYAVSSSHDSYIFGWTDVSGALNYTVKIKQNDTTIWSTNALSTTTCINWVDETDLLDSGEYTLELTAVRSSGGDIVGKETFYTIPQKNIISWKIFDTFTLYLDNNTTVFAKRFKIEKKDDWQKFYISSKPDSASGWSMENMLLYCYSSETAYSTTTNSSPSGDSLFIDVPPDTSEIYINLYNYDAGVASLSHDLYLVRWSPEVIIIGGSGMTETSSDQYSTVAVVGEESTQAELRYIINSEDLPHNAGLSSAEKETLNYPLNGVFSNSFSVTLNDSGFPSMGIIKADALSGSFSITMPESDCYNWEDTDNSCRRQPIVPPAPLVTEVSEPPIPGRTSFELNSLPGGETPTEFMLHIIEPSISTDRGSISTICSAYLYDYLHDKYPFDSSCLWNGWYEGGCSDETTTDYGTFTLNLKNPNGEEIPDNVLEVSTTQGASKFYTDEFKYYWRSDETNTICRLTLGGEEIWSTNVVRPSLENNSYECSGTGGLYIESDECDSCGSCSDGSCEAFNGDELSSIRFRAILGFVGDQKLAGLIYFDEKTMPTEITPLIFKIFDKPYVDRVYTGGYLSLIKCDMEGGRNITISSFTNQVNEAGVKLEIRNYGDSTIQSTWDITKAGNSVHFVNYNKGLYVVADNSYFYTNGVWSKTDNLKNTVEEIIETGDYHTGLTKENNTYGNNGKIIYSSITDESYIGNTNAIRTTYSSDYGIGGLKSETYNTYWEDNEHFLRNGKLKFSSVYNIVDNDGTMVLGDWQYNIFDEYGRRTLQIRPLNGSEYPSFVTFSQGYDFDDGDVQPFTGKVTVKDYQPIAGSGDSNHADDINRPRRIDKYIVNSGFEPILISRTWQTYTRETNVYPIVVSRSERAISQDSTFAEDNRVSWSRAYATETNIPSLLRGRPISQQSSDGSLYTWEYETVGGNFRIISRSGTVDLTNGIANVSTYDVEIIDATFGHTVSNLTYLYTDGGTSSDPVISSTGYEYDSLRRQTIVSYSDGTFTSNYWPCCHLGETTDRSGVHTKNLNDHNNLDYYGQAQISVAGLSGALGNYPVTESFPNAYGFETSSVQRVYNNGTIVTEYEPLTTTTEYIGSISNASAITITTDQIGVQNQNISSNIQMGSVNCSIDGAGVTSIYISVTGGSSTNITTWTNQFGNTVWTKTWNETTYNSDGTRISTSYKSASLGTPSPSSAYVTQVTYYDFQGRVVATHTPAPHTDPVAESLGLGNYNWTSNFYDSTTGRLAYTERSTSVASGVDRRIYKYNFLGQLEHTAQDANDNNTIDLDGTDRIQGSSTYYEQINSEWYRTSVSCVQTTGLGENWSSTVAESLGLGTGNAEPQLGIDSNAKCIAFSTSENLNGNTTTNMTFLDASTATKWQISASSLSACPSINKTIAGYPVMTVSSLGTTNTFTYDGFTRQSSSLF